MKNIKSHFRNIYSKLAGNEKGVSAIEYGLIAGLVALVIITAVTTLGTNLNGIFSRIATSV
ncbi:Flp family type IVb pilin [Polynucleobacter arcticus]|uniref:Flp family type IVb pilin n=1 Tax=Polynucleobacter arcticus TaxID=1743165 RepID=A0A6M9PME6_9BURK|nr:Flp family type IVb pilin [Polynucleobacter arcticus]QKM60095.1 Flp family type IVb pilin [Polynucleobacter arcticus]